MSAPLVAVVDDDARIRDLLAAELEDLGAEVLRCRDGSDLLNATQLSEVQLVLLDWMMPGLNGEATLLGLRSRQFRGRVVVVTALCDPQVQATAQAAGAAATLLKTEALEQLERWLNQG
jgi:DNA-binding response OmpR family regulator